MATYADPIERELVSNVEKEFANRVKCSSALGGARLNNTMVERCFQQHQAIKEAQFRLKEYRMMKQNNIKQ